MGRHRYQNILLLDNTQQSQDSFVQAVRKPQKEWFTPDTITAYVSVSRPVCRVRRGSVIAKSGLRCKLGRGLRVRTGMA